MALKYIKRCSALLIKEMLYKKKIEKKEMLYEITLPLCRALPSLRLGQVVCPPARLPLAVHRVLPRRWGGEAELTSSNFSMRLPPQI